MRFSPAMGHLHAHSTRTITATFAADKPMRLSGSEVKLLLQQISYKGGGPPVEWDDAMSGECCAGG